MVEPKKYDFEFEGMQYQQKSLKEAEKITGIPWRTLQKRQLRGRSIQEAIDFKRVKRNKVKNLYNFEFEGKRYEQKSLPEVAEIVGLDKKTLEKRLERGRSIQEAIDFKRVKRNKVKNVYDFTYQGEEYKQKSIPEISEIIGVDKKTLEKRLERARSIQEAIDFKRPKYNKVKNVYDFEFNGKEYQNKTMKEISDITGIKRRTLDARLERGRTIQEAVDFKRVKRNKVKNLYDFEFEGKIYENKTMKEISDITGIKMITLYARLNRGRSLQESIDFERSKYNKAKNVYDFKFNGKEYQNKTITEISDITGIKMITLYARLNRGRSIQEAIDFRRVKRNKS